MRPDRAFHDRDAIFFDFDGVIVDSVEAKIQAFGELYRPFGDAVRLAVMAYQRAHPGETRYDKIPRFHRDLLGVALTGPEIERWCARLGDIVIDRVVESPLLPDVAATLAALQDAGVRMHVVSGTPQDELALIARRKRIDGYFHSLEGSPRSKPAILSTLIAAHGLSPHRCLFVGDAMTDHDAAAAFAMPFLGCMTAGSHPFPPGTAVVARLGEACAAEKPGRRDAA